MENGAERIGQPAENIVRSYLPAICVPRSASSYAKLTLKSEKMTFYPDWYRIRLPLPPAFSGSPTFEKKLN